MIFTDSEGREFELSPYNGNGVFTKGELLIRPVKQEPKKRAMLGYATTRELLAELTARIEVSGELDYSTFYGNPNDSMRENN